MRQNELDTERENDTDWSTGDAQTGFWKWEAHKWEIEERGDIKEKVLNDEMKLIKRYVDALAQVITY